MEQEVGRDEDEEGMFVKTKYRFLCCLAIIGVCFPVITYGGGAGERSRPDAYEGSVTQEPRPIWIEQPPEPGDTVYFVGRSDSDKVITNGSYLEKKGDALADVLAQFAAYRGVRVESMRSEYGDNNKRELEDVFNISADIIDSAGLYQKAEWMDTDGTIYVLYAYSAQKNLFYGNFPVSFEFIYEDNRVYFVGAGVSRQADTPALAELSLQAEADAKMQALLWFGGHLQFLEKDYFKEQENQGNKIITGFSEAALNFGSRFDLSGSSFRKEDSKIQKERDGKYHYYNLYSLSADAGDAKKIPEYGYFTYHIETAQQNEADIGTKKRLVFGGQEYARTEFTPVAAGNADALRPEWIKNLPYSPEGAIWETGNAKAPSMVMQNIIAQGRALVSIAHHVYAVTNSTFNKFSREGNNDTTEAFEIIDRMLTNIDLAGVVKRNDFVAGDNTSWQLWECPKSEVEAAKAKAEEDKRKVEELIR